MDFSEAITTLESKQTTSYSLLPAPSDSLEGITVNPWHLVQHWTPAMFLYQKLYMGLISIKVA